MLRYYTTSNGHYEYDDGSDPLAINTAIYMQATAAFDGRDAFGYVTPATMDIHDYQVSAPQLNLQQGEVNEDGAWMGGGVGETLTGIWEDPSQGFHDWGFNTDCADSPYYILKGGSDFWNNGGYG